MKKLLCLTGMLLFLMAASACGKEEVPEGTEYQVYYISRSETKVEMHPYWTQTESRQAILRELMQCLSTTPEKLEYQAPLAMGFEILGIDLDEGKMTMDVNAAYKNLSVTTEVLVRAAIVRTLAQLPEISYVEITVEGEPLVDSMSNVVGRMSADQFIDNDGNEINTYELARVKLFFASDSGTQLIAAYREKHYSTNTPIERFIVEELIAGPSGQVAGLHPTLNPNTKVINVTTKDGICYVNLDENFLTVPDSVSMEAAVYSIVNSLVELSNINKVQIMVNGEVPTTSSIFQNSTFERNLDMITSLKN
ncbi:MAG: GerMN domain-containing protein [Eubacterium sp.]|nr:GerMN domain-containing protein [Eubacterium sp.]MCM1213177.1 GerMN domain-containing protein [Lachnospiraceae bacterium]MCM1303747.1 GerMN domain-containing protein [Butyrivibrio sp.]MCM1344585.1 GerMN domain-containing protein [Muribaculaceae bacterium]MCM1239481.1 GerMN domain-containing protein [Lachnospiraceae bacterium]